MSASITEDQLEQLCLDWFKSIGYDYVCGDDITPDGDNPERIRNMGTHSFTVCSLINAQLYQ